MPTGKLFSGRFLPWILLLAASIRLAAQTPLPPGTTAPPDADHSAVSRAEEALQRSDWKAATSLLSDWAAAHPADARAQFDLAYAADADGRSDDAVAAYRKAIAADPGMLQAHLSLGLLLARMSHGDEARSELETVAQSTPLAETAAWRARAWRALARLDAPSQAAPGDPAKASTELLEALKLSPETDNDTLLAAQIAAAAGDFPAAEAAYRRLLAARPDSVPGNAGIGHALLAEKKYADAEPYLRKALEASPGDAVLTAELAQALSEMDKGEALPVLEALHAQTPKDENVARLLADVRSEAGDYAGSEALLAPLLAAHPADAGLLVAHGHNAVLLQHDNEAFAAFTRATSIDPANGDAWSGLAFAASRLGRPDVTLHALTERSKFRPELASTYFLWATSYDSLHDRQQAVTYYHHFLDAAAGKFPDQEWQARQRLQLLERSH